MAHKKEQIDHLFKGALSGYSPPPSDNVWQNISTSLAQQGAFQGFWVLYRVWILSAAAILLLSLGTIWFFTRPATPSAAPSSAVVQHYPTREENTPHSGLAGNGEGQTTLSPSSQLSSLQRTASAANVSTNISPATEEEHILHTKQMKEGLPSPLASASRFVDVQWKNQRPSVANDALPLERIKQRNPSLQILLKEGLKGAPRDLRSQAYHQQKETEIGLSQNSARARWNHFLQTPYYLCVGFSAGPEYLFESKGRRNAGVDYGLEFYYNKSDLVLRGGVHLARYGDKGLYNLNYERVDSLGYIYTVESFTVDPNNPDSIIFKMDVEGVYDSVQVSEKRSTDAYYSYLRVPVMVGYTIAEKDNFSLDLTGGPVFNLLVKSHNPRPTFPEGENIYKKEVEDQSNPWIKSNIQLRAALSMHYRFSNHLRFTFEPTYNYYLNPIYSRATNHREQPFAIGARLGLLYKL